MLLLYTLPPAIASQNNPNLTILPPNVEKVIDANTDIAMAKQAVEAAKAEKGIISLRDAYVATRQEAVVGASAWTRFTNSFKNH